MNSDLNLYVIALVVVLVLLQTLFHFRKRTRSLIISSIGTVIAWTFDRCNRLLHVMLMSPAKARSGAQKGGQE